MRCLESVILEKITGCGVILTAHLVNSLSDIGNSFLLFEQSFLPFSMTGFSRFMFEMLSVLEILID